MHQPFHLEVLHQIQQGLAVDPGRPQQFLAEGAAEFIDPIIDAEPHFLEADLAHQGKTVAVHPA